MREPFPNPAQMNLGNLVLFLVNNYRLVKFSQTYFTDLINSLVSHLYCCSHYRSAFLDDLSVYDVISLLRIFI